MKPAKLNVGVNPKITADACALKVATASVMAFSAMMLLNWLLFFQSIFH